MSMIDPITGLTTPLRYLGGRSVLGGFPVPSFPSTLSPLTGGIAGLSGSPTAPLARGLASAATSSPLPFSQAGGLASRVPLGAGEEAFNAANALRGAGGVGGVASRAGLGGLAGDAGLFAGANFSRAALLKGSGYGLAGAAGSGLIDKLNIGGQNSNVEQALQGAAQGAGIGAGVGSIFPGIGTALGAGLGAGVGSAVGILGNLFGGGGGDKKALSPVEIINNAVNTANLPPEAQANILRVYATQMALAQQYEDGSDERKLAEAAALEAAGQAVLAAVNQQASSSSQLPNMLALQAQAQDIFAPIAQDITDSGALYADAMRGIRDRLPEQYRSIADLTTARELQASNRLANAYRAQAAVTPAIRQLTQYQQDFNNYAAQQFSQALAQQAAGMGGGGAADVQALLAPTG